MEVPSVLSNRFSSVIGLIASSALFNGSLTFAAPENGVVVAGSGTISTPTTGTMVINRIRRKAINWSSLMWVKTSRQLQPNLINRVQCIFIRVQSVFGRDLRMSRVV